uniref:Ankyrin n=1 Tax=Peronospora matthiolae TaxID=2874970 RepID=A0AAV1TQT2_9STRA
MHQTKPESSPAACSQHRHIDTSEWPGYPVPTIISAICRKYLHGNIGDGVLRLIDSCLVTPFDSLTLLKAYYRSGGSLRLLQYLAVRELKVENPSRHDWEVNAVTGQMAARGDLHSLKWIIKNYVQGEFKLKLVVYHASANGQMSIIQWFWENHRGMGCWGDSELCQAIRSRHVMLIEWLKSRVAVRFEHTGYMAHEAAAFGSLEIIEWLHERFDIVLVDALKTAAVHNEWTVVQWIIDHGNRADLDAALRFNCLYTSAARFGNLDMLQLLFDRSLPQDPVFVLESAILGGHLHIVKWLHEEKGITNAVAGYIDAARKGQLDMLRYLFEKGVIATPYLFPINAAAEAGRLEVVQWLHSHTTTKCTERAMDAAAGQGHLHIVQWLHENRTEGCTRRAMDRAASNGHLDVVKWLYENRTEGCSRRTIDDAGWFGYSGALAWLFEN